MIYYPLSVLMLAGLREILLISTPQDLPRFEQLLGDGSDFGIELSYIEQKDPNGIAEAFILGEEFLAGDSACLILGDNVFYGHDFVKLLESSKQQVETRGGGTVFGYYVTDPERYGVVDFNKNGEVLSIEEKPATPRSNYAVTGLYFYDDRVSQLAKELKPSARGELEITDLNLAYLAQKALRVEVMGRGYAWLDTGTTNSLLQASNFVRTIEERQGFKIACLEEIAFYKGWLSENELKERAVELSNNDYGQYLERIIKLKQRP